MAYTNLFPRTLNLTGADLSGTDGTAGRTYTIPYSGVLSDGINIAVNGTSLFEGATKDFTVSSSVITFINIVDNTDNIRVLCFTSIVAPSASILSTSTTLKYSTPLMLAQLLGIESKVPSWDVAGTPTNEAVGTGTGSLSTFYLDHQGIISDTYTLYAAGVAMTETTHYTLDCDNGKITITAAGLTFLATGALTAMYSYYSNAMLNSHIITVLGRAEKEVDGVVNSVFTDGTATNPAYPLCIETMASMGLFTNRYIVANKPLVDISSLLASDITALSNTLTVTTGEGEDFPTSGYVVIGTEVISYTGITSNTLTGLGRGALGSTAAIHSAGASIHSTLVMFSDTSEGTDETFTIQEWDVSIYADENGVVYRYASASPDPLTKVGIANRVKVYYYYGYNTVPLDVTRLALLFAKRQLLSDNIGAAQIQGRNEFRPEMVNVDLEEIERIKNKYIVLPMGNV